MREKKRQVPQNISGENLLFGLTISSSVLLLLLQLVIIGAVVFTNLQNQDLRMVGNQEGWEPMTGQVLQGRGRGRESLAKLPRRELRSYGKLGKVS